MSRQRGGRWHLGPLLALGVLAAPAGCGKSTSEAERSGIAGASAGTAGGASGGAGANGGVSGVPAAAGTVATGGVSMSGGAAGRAMATGAGGIALGGGGGAGEAPSTGGTFGLGGVGSSCFGAALVLAPSPLDLYLLLDSSGSMLEPSDASAGPTPTKWAVMADGLSTLFSDPSSEGMSVALGYFPQLVVSGETNCELSAYETPTVEFAALPDGAASLVTSLALREPGGDTPTGQALTGALTHARAWSAAHGDHTVAIVLATDGMPAPCITGTEAEAVEQTITAAEDGFAPAEVGEASVRTFVLGVGSDAETETTLDQLAKAGGTDSAYALSAASELGEGIVAALQAIRAEAAGCSFALIDQTGRVIDPTRVNLVITPPDQASEVLPYVGLDGCEAEIMGWRYDVDYRTSTPGSVVLCPATCAVLRASPQTELEALVGCAAVND